MLPVMLGSYSATVTVPTVFLFICSLHRLSRVSCSCRNRKGFRFTSNTACKLSPAFRPRFSHGKYTKRFITLPRFFFHRYFWRVASHFYQECKIFNALPITHIHTFSFHISTSVSTWQPSENVNLFVSISLQNAKLQSISACFSFLLKETDMYFNPLMLSVVTASFLVNVE